MAKSNTTLYMGGAAALVGLYLFTSRSAPTLNTGLTTALTNPLSNNPNIPAPPLAYNDAYYKTYQYPALVRQYPELQNPGHQLTDAEAQGYKNNYLELQQWLPSVLGKLNWQFPNEKAALQYHWSKFGVPYQYSFIPFTPPKNANWTPPPKAPTASSSGGGIFSDILHVVTTVAPYAAALLGPNDTAGLNDADIELIMTSAPLTKKIISFYLDADKTLVDSISFKLNDLVSQYAY